MVYVLTLSPGGSIAAQTRLQGGEPVLIKAGEQLTHIASAEVSHGTQRLGTVRALPRPVQFLELPSIIPKRLVSHALRVFRSGGRLPPKTGESIMAALEHIFPGITH